eukprot:COSAG02_NODE_13978_length_1324_cov_5.211429_1_plen_63_part_10
MCALARRRRAGVRAEAPPEGRALPWEDGTTGVNDAEYCSREDQTRGRRSSIAGGQASGRAGRQ